MRLIPVLSPCFVSLCCGLLCFLVFQALFRKLATALPGMESAPATSNNANLIDIKVGPVRSHTYFFFLLAFAFLLRRLGAASFGVFG